MNFAKQSPRVIYVARKTSLGLSVSKETAKENNAIVGLQSFSSFRGKTQRPLYIFLLYAGCLKFLGSRFHLNLLAQINTIYIYSTEKEIRRILGFS